MNSFEQMKNFLLIFCLYASVIRAQDAPSGFPVAIELADHVGSVLKIWSIFPPVNRPANFNDLNFIFPFKPGTSWYRKYKSPEIGCALVYGNLGNDAVLGRQIAVMPNISFDARHNSRWGFRTKIGMGLAWFNKPYNINTNPTNFLIGSSITNITNLSFCYRYSLTDHWNAYAGASFLHFSNGHYQLPNIGVNVPGMEIGLKYYPKGRPVCSATDTSNPAAVDHRLHFNLFAGEGLHQFGSAGKPTGGPRYPVYQAGAYLVKRSGFIHNWQAGFLLTYYTDYYNYIVDQELFTSNQRLQSFALTAFVGHEFILSHVGLITQLGYNVYNPFYEKVNVDQVKGFTDTYLTSKIGITYYINNPMITNKNRIFVGIYLECHFTEADFSELGFGYSF
jgi:hypothetical protein